MSPFPIFVDLRDRRCLVVGGGAVGARKAAALLRSGAIVDVVAPWLSASFADEICPERVRHHARPFDASDVDGATLVVAASDSKATNAAVSAACKARGVLVNVVDDPELCTFLVPAIVDRAPLVVAVSTGGEAPVLARHVRERIEAMLPARLGTLAWLAGSFRTAVKERIVDPIARRRFWEDALRGRVARLVDAGRDADAEALLQQSLHAVAEGEPPVGRVALVGAGPGSADLLTLRALRRLQEADVVLYDRLVGRDVLDLARRDARRIDVGKAPGDPGLGQAGIEALLVKLAREGNAVVRLKAGDPGVFGRGGEEALTLAQAGIEVEVVPGVTAALGASAVSGIPLTFRGVADAVTFVTATRADDEDGADWAALARPGQTVVVYMGVGRLGAVARALVAHGRAPTTPIALVERATHPGERVVVGTLGDAEALARAEAVAAPALLIVGEVVDLRVVPSASIPVDLAAPAA